MVKGKYVSVKKQKKVPVVVLSSKERALEDTEEKFIVSAYAKSSRVAEAPKELPEGPIQQTDVNAAVKKGVKDCSSLLLNWNTKNAKIIGALCKVFWDGDNEWFYGRILNYDSHHNRHFVSSDCFEYFTASC